MNAEIRTGTHKYACTDLLYLIIATYFGFLKAISRQRILVYISQANSPSISPSLEPSSYHCSTQSNRPTWFQLCILYFPVTSFMLTTSKCSLILQVPKVYFMKNLVRCASN